MSTERPVRIYLDPYRMEEAGDVSVEDSDSYWRARVAVMRAVLQNQSLKVLVRNRSMRSFFDDLAERDDVEIRPVDPRTRLQDALGGVSLPPQLTEDPAAVVDLGLTRLASQSPRYADEDADSWLLRVTLGPLWSQQAINNTEDLAKVILSCLPAPSKYDHPILIPLRRQRLDAWAAMPGSYRDVLRWLAVAPSDHSRAFLVGQVLRAYPWHQVSQWLVEDGVATALNALPDHRSWLDQAPLDIPPPDAERLVPRGVLIRMDRFLRSAIADEGLGQALSMTGGKLPCELNVVRHALADLIATSTPLSAEDAAKLRECFSGHPGGESLLVLTDELAQAPTPSAIRPDATWPEVHAWLLDEYFPFYRRVSLLGTFESTVPTTSAFEDWLLANYLDLTRMGDCLTHTLPGTISAAAAKGPVLVVIVDGLGGQWAETMADALARSGLSVSAPDLRLSVLPTLTEPAKAAMLRGQLPNQFELSQAGASEYRSLLTRALGMDESRLHLATDRDSSPQELVQRDGDVFVLLANELDENLVHRPLPRLTRWDRIRQLLSELARSAAEAAQFLEGRNGRPVSVIVVGDHGTTEVSPKERGALPIPEGHQETHRRVVLGICSEPPEGTVHLDPAKFLLRAGVTVAKGYRYFGERPRGLTHGGITPQEVAVPFLLASTAQPRPLAGLVVTVSGAITRGRSDNEIQVAVLNPNQEQVRISGLRLRLARWGSETSFRLKPGEERQLQTYLDASEVRSAEVVLTGTVEWQHAGRSRTQEIHQVIRTSGAAVSDADFEEMFDRG